MDQNPERKSENTSIARYRVESGIKYFILEHFVIAISSFMFQNWPFFAPLEQSELCEERGEYYQYPDEKNAMFRRLTRGHTGELFYPGFFVALTHFKNIYFESLYRLINCVSVWQFWKSISLKRHNQNINGIRRLLFHISVIHNCIWHKVGKISTCLWRKVNYSTNQTNSGEDIYQEGSKQTEMVSTARGRNILSRQI